MTMSNTYTTKIVDSSRELTPVERVKYKNISDVIKLDELLRNEGFITIKVKDYYTLEIHNERTENTDYLIYVIIDDEDNRYTTSSESFWNSFSEIAEELYGTEYEWFLKIYTIDSKNYQGRKFITCCVV